MPENVKPIIFSGPMVRAILEGRKTQTRRVLKPQIVCSTGITPSFYWGKFSGVFPDDWFGHGNEIDGALPYLPGDILWVREQWRIPAMDDFYSPSEVAAMSIDAGYASPWSAIEYCADGTRANWTRDYGDPGRNRSSIHMPRWASRLTLEVTDVRIQRLQAISEADAEAEGIEDCKSGGLAPLWRVYGPPPKPAFGMIGNLSNNRGQFATDARDSFSTLWDSIYEARGDGWSSNPWVAALTFSVVRRNVDEVAS